MATQKPAAKPAPKPAPTPNLPAVVKPGGMLAKLDEATRNELMEAAKEASAVETPQSSAISFRNGQMTIGGAPVPDNNMNFIVVASVHERALYDGLYDPNKPRSPVCFALSTDGRDMGPHEASENPQGDEDGKCFSCPMNEWGSAGNNRKGKACKEIRRLGVIPTDKLESAEDIIGAEVATAKIPVTSVGNWATYVQTLSTGYNVPFWAVITNISVAPHIKNQFEVSFDFADEIDDVPALRAIKAKREDVLKLLMEPYSPNAQEEAAPPPSAKPPIRPKKF